LLTDKLVDIDKKKYDRICCLEVFEHLTDEAINLILDDFHRMLTDDGFIIIGVPNEIYLAALIRGLFRMSRRFGSYDAKLINIVCATFGIPPKDRPWKGDSPRSTYASPHMGFDHRELRVLLSNRFCITKVYGSPFKHLPLLFNTEVYFILKKSSN
jgi:hypothetical protein